jgi:hypothetical protein
MYVYIYIYITCYLLYRPMELLCSDGKIRNVVFPLCFHAGDWPEQCDIAGLMKSTTAAEPCNQCHIHKSELFNCKLGRPRTLEELQETRAAAEAEEDSGTRGCVGRAKAMYVDSSMRKLIEVEVSYDIS